MDQNCTYITDLLEATRRADDLGYFIFRPESLGSLEQLAQAITDRKIILTTTAPRALTLHRKEGDPACLELLSQSDYQTLRLAQYFHQKRILIAKDTPGIFTSDPLIGYNSHAKRRNERWQRVQRNNRFHPSVSVEDLLERTNISRVGVDNKDQHLWEDAALRVMIGTDSEVIVVCPQYSRFAPEGNSVLPFNFPPNISDEDYFYHCIKAAIGKEPGYNQYLSRITSSRARNPF